MLVLYHLLAHVELLLPRQVGAYLHLLRLVTPKALLEPHAHLFLLNRLRFLELLQVLLVFLGQVLPRCHLALLPDQEWQEGGELLDEGLLEQDGLAAQHQRHHSFFPTLEDCIFDDDGVSWLDLVPKEGVVAVDCPATGGHSA
jgi:hypothetical protein